MVKQGKLWGDLSLNPQIHPLSLVTFAMTHSSQPPTDNNPKPLTPLRSLIGAVIAGVMAVLLYRLTTSVVHSFMAHPTSSRNQIVMSLSAAVRTLVIGSMTMGTGIFGLVTLGLVALALKLAYSREAPRPKDIPLSVEMKAGQD
jgi:Protein of unknown function (DUF3082)